MKKIIGIILVIGISVGAGAFFYYRGGSTGDQQPQQKSIHHFAPDDPSFVAEATNLTNLDRAFQNLNISRQFRQSQFRNLYQQRVKPMMKSFQTRETKAQLKQLNKITQLLGNEFLMFGDEKSMQTVAVYNLHKPKKDVANPYEPVDQLLQEKLVNRFNSAKAITHSSETHRQVTIHQLSFQLPEEAKTEKIKKLKSFVSKFSLQYARLHNHLLMGIGDGALKEAIDHYATTDKPRSSLVKSPKRKKTPRLSYRIEGSYLKSIYDYFEKTMPEDIKQQNQFQLNKKMMEGYDVSRGSISFRKSLLTFENELKWNPKKILEPFKPGLNQNPKQLVTNQYLPKNTIFSLTSLSPESKQFFNWYLENVIKPRFFGEESGNDDSVLEATMPIDGFKMMLDALKTEIGIGIYLNNSFFDSLYKQESLPSETYPMSGLISLEVENQSALNRAFDKIGKNPFVNYSPSQRQLTLDLVLFKLPLHLRKDGNFTLVGLSQNELSSAVERRNNRSGLTTLKRFRSLRKNLPEKVNQLSYFSAAPWAAPLRHDWLKTFAPQQRNRVMTMAGFNPLKELGRVMRGTKGTMGGQWNVPSEHRSEGVFYTSGDILMPTATIGAGAAIYPYFKDKVNKQMGTTRNTDKTSSDLQKPSSETSTKEGQASLSAAIYN